MPYSRRRFLKHSVAAAGAMLAWPALDGLARAETPVRVRGVVRAAGRGLASVAVTDGRTVAATAADGTFELIANANRPFVYLSLPAGYRIPRHATGTAHLYRPLRPDAAGEAEAVFELEPDPRGDDAHAFVVLADPQTQDAYDMGRFHAETVPSVAATIAALGDVPVFGVADGDIMYDHLELYPEYERAVERMGVPFFQVVGNHDLDFDGLTDEASIRTFQRHFGPPYYSFDRGAVHYVVLDDVFWNHAGYFGYLDAAQLAWLEADLARVEAGRPVVVFLHIPVHSTASLRRGEAVPSPRNAVTNREALYRLLEPYAAHVISGHTHESEHVFEGGVHEHVCGAACGAWWSGPICYDGTPNGYAVYEVRGEELRWRYQGTDQAPDHQMRLYAPGADAAHPRALVANVWDWDPAWSVVFYEGGDRRGALERRLGTDPLAERLHRGTDKPPRRTWVEPVPTGHLFYAEPSGAGPVRVEATDRFGRVYTATLGG